MAIRTKVLVVDSDLDSLSKVYLALLHRNYKVEAADKAGEIAERVKRFRPAVLVMGIQEFRALQDAFKIPGIVMMDETSEPPEPLSWKDVLVSIPKPVQIDQLVKTIEELAL